MTQNKEKFSRKSNITGKSLSYEVRYPDQENTVHGNLKNSKFYKLNIQ